MGGKEQESERRDYSHGENELPYLPVREVLSSSNMITKQQSALLCNYFIIGQILFSLFFSGLSTTFELEERHLSRMESALLATCDPS